MSVLRASSSLSPVMPFLTSILRTNQILYAAHNKPRTQHTIMMIHCNEKSNGALQAEFRTSTRWSNL